MRGVSRQHGERGSATATLRSSPSVFKSASMTRHILAAMLLGAALSGCADELPSIADPGKPIIHDLAAVAARDFAIDDEHEASLHEPDEPGSCEPPTDEGPCSLLCDPDALIETYVPEGTCVHFLCTLRDGTRRNIGACHWP